MSEEIQDEIELTETKEILLKEISSLNERDKLIVSLYYNEELSYKEIANILGITVQRVSQLHIKILQILKKPLEDKSNG